MDVTKSKFPDRRFLPDESSFSDISAIYDESVERMTTQFGFLSKLEFLQDWASECISRIHPAFTHNMEKYYVLKKVHYLSAIEQIHGDYLEFGIYTGSSFCHSIRCCKQLSRLHPAILDSKFYGFDSFSGFGTLSEADRHPFYTDANFATDKHKVEQRVRRVAGDIQYKLIPGFFSDSLRDGPGQYGITKARIIFIDSDTYASAQESLTFCMPIIQEGTYIILDDFFSYRGSEKRGVACAFSEFISQAGVKARQVFTYGMGGVSYVISEIPG